MLVSGSEEATDAVVSGAATEEVVNGATTEVEEADEGASVANGQKTT